MPRDELVRYKPIPQNRSVHQILTTDHSCQLILRDLSCYCCDNCVEKNYLDCNNKDVTSRKHAVKREFYANETEENDNGDGETSIENLIEKDSILALFTDDPGEEYYLLKALSPPNILKRETKDSWGALYPPGTEVIKGHYFEKIENFRYRLIKNMIAYVPLMSVKHVLLNDCHDNILAITENDHLDILAAVDNS